MPVIDNCSAAFFLNHLHRAMKLRVTICCLDSWSERRGLETACNLWIFPFFWISVGDLPASEMV